VTTTSASSASARAIAEIPDLLRQPFRIQPTGVADDAHTLGPGQLQALRDLIEKRLGVAEGRVRQHVLEQDEHGQLREPVAGDDVDVAARQLLAHRRAPVAVEPAAVGDHQRCAHRLGSRPAPDGPAKAWATSSQACATGPVATRSRSERWLRWVTRRAKS
jgi:hypothetical protein